MQPPTQLRKWIALCLGLLLAVFMTLEVAHTHPTDARDNGASAHCQICTTAHVAVDSKPSWLTGYVMHLIGTVSQGEPSSGSRVVVVTAFIRPPPPVATLR